MSSGEGFREFNQLRTLETSVMGSKMKEAKPNFRQLKLSSWSVAQQEFDSVDVVSKSYSELEILAKVLDK